MPEENPPWLEKALSLPDSPGVYQFFDREGKCIYVGKASSLKQRIKAYLQRGSGFSEKAMLIREKAVDLTFTVTGNVPEAMILESTLVKELKPLFNVKLKDDKRFPYLEVSLSQQFPRISIVRSFKKGDDRYFGPFTEAKALRKTIRTIKEIFKIPSCRVPLPGKNPRAPCLEYQIKRCSAPCAGLISQEEYQEAVKEMILFLEGKTPTLIGNLENRMNQEVRRLNFEGAAKIRDQIFALKKIWEKQVVFSHAPLNRDLVGFYLEGGEGCLSILRVRHGKLFGSDHFILTQAEGEDFSDLQFVSLTQYYERTLDVPTEVIVKLRKEAREALKRWMEAKKGVRVSFPQPRGEAKKQLEIAQQNAKEQLKLFLKTREARGEGDLLLQRVQQDLGLSSLPLKIEGYDISNLGIKEAVGAKVLFRNGERDVSGFRHFKVRLRGQNDYAMIQEILERRLSSKEELPNLILIDGGLGHLHAALEVVKNFGKKIDVISLAKGKELVFSPQFPEPLEFEPGSPSLKLLQRVRDEAHRFANSFQRKTKERKIRRSKLEEIPGIGVSKKSLLLRAFGSLRALENASFLQIASIPGIGEKSAQKIYTYLHRNMDTEEKSS
ncbi:MAG: excinuclease ABC subunit UvrC [Caldiserica bacterium]|jgi:excinuclease ABC subunit C|nr:excinuclease ABC subunit UvrC [Caldisericota bacterium]MDH7562732.1 excinuclease ABC subunit UvrC [Caldisericota bacterium]